MEAERTYWSCPVLLLQGPDLPSSQRLSPTRQMSQPQTPGNSECFGSLKEKIGVCQNTRSGSKYVETDNTSTMVCRFGEKIQIGAYGSEESTGPGVRWAWVPIPYLPLTKVLRKKMMVMSLYLRVMKRVR